MSKKTMMLALAVASVTMFALPSTASAQEIHLEGVTSSSGTAGATSLTAEGEPVITCESGHWSLSVQAGGTTGSITFHYTGCHTTVFGITSKCRTSGSALDNTIHFSATWHLNTISSGVPGILDTPVVTTIVCAGITNTITGGNIIGTITSPACGTESTEMTTSFTATGSVQNHKTYTGTTYNLTAKTGESGTVKAAGLVSTATTKSATKGKLNCT